MLALPAVGSMACLNFSGHNIIMRVSQLLGVTLKESPGGVELASHDLLVRAGYIRQLSSGIFSYLHLGHRSLQKIQQILREEMDKIGGVEISMPVVHPADIWKKTGRYEEIDESLVRFSDRADRDLVLAMTHEEVVSSLAQSEVTSYKQLPLLVYQIQTKFRDEARPRGGLIRVKEFAMKDSYSLDASWEGLAKQYEAHYEAYFRIFARSGVPVVAIKSDVGMMGGKVAHEFMYLSEIGEDTIFICDKTGYKANKEVAVFRKKYPQDEPLSLQKVHTPGSKTIAEVAQFLGVEEEKCGKMVFFTALISPDLPEKLVAVVIRGDMEVNPVKLQKLAHLKSMRPATEAEILAAGTVPGYASPMSLHKKDCLIIADDLVAHSPNLVLGADQTDYHYKNTCYGRDYEADLVGDIAMAYEDALSPDTNDDTARLRAVRGVEVGNIFQLGTKYTEGLDAYFMDEQGKSKPLIMGSYGIGVGRILACAAEEHRDKDGLNLPISIAPYSLLLVALIDSAETQAAADTLYHALQNAGIDVLYDDRKIKSAGVKFKDADLWGIPLRLTLSKKSLQKGGVELKRRGEKNFSIVPKNEVLETVKQQISQLFDEITLN